MSLVVICSVTKWITQWCSLGALTIASGCIWGGGGGEVKWGCQKAYMNYYLDKGRGPQMDLKRQEVIIAHSCIGHTCCRCQNDFLVRWLKFVDGRLT